jgi:hypothetical protein
MAAFDVFQYIWFLYASNQQDLDAWTKICCKEDSPPKEHTSRAIMSSLRIIFSPFLFAALSTSAWAGELILHSSRGASDTIVSESGKSTPKSQKSEGGPKSSDGSRPVKPVVGGREYDEHPAPDKLTALRKDAEKGNASAQSTLGYYLSLGVGGRKDLEEAVQWYYKAASQGEAVAQLSLAFCYARGEGTKADPAQAAAWFNVAAKSGVSMAQLCLGYAYETGDGVPADPKVSAQWFLLAARQGETKAQTRMGLYYSLGTGVDKDPTKASYWFREAAMRGDTCAMLNLGSCYQAGSGVKKDLAKAFVWWTLALQNGEEAARTELNSLRQGMTPDQIKEAEKHLKSSRDPRAWAAQ